MRVHGSPVEKSVNSIGLLIGSLVNANALNSRRIGIVERFREGKIASFLCVGKAVGDEPSSLSVGERCLLKKIVASLRNVETSSRACYPDCVKLYVTADARDSVCEYYPGSVSMRAKKVDCAFFDTGFCLIQATGGLPPQIGKGKMVSEEIYKSLVERDIPV
ncbi:hypothetical protein Tco_0509681 [Tanacetum coccineum]